MSLQYSVWREKADEEVRWMWEVADVQPDGTEIPIKGGIEDDVKTARQCAHDVIRKAEFEA